MNFQNEKKMKKKQKKLILLFLRARPAIELAKLSLDMGI